MPTVASQAGRAANSLPAKHLITVEAYRKMGEAGIFSPEARVELIEGEIFDRAPIGSEHASMVKRINEGWVSALRGRAIVSVQDPVVLGDLSEPQPDLALLRRREDFYAGCHPSREDILLIVEISDTSARYDREVKVPLYARHDIPEAWLMDLQQQRLEVYYGPKAGEYQHIDFYREGVVSPQAFPDLKLSFAGLGWK
ncbi:protein of unknown function DUF820 [Nitrosococcus halophilus Nc 4]|uniref:Putative restriction endonuclease domain-containing protein n=1 Tax=Nitrosococcus halophilus (strain Nc4) TaxID=472759 RepID=D5BXY9_NITHN|nr:Uma2 family endonuclease [Nitrosococcus halophilus]ADE15900.1 protein of unknown function DUF820 [Nitrosococcus halophilus Nc 4]